MSRVVTIGTFDPPHLGHAMLIARCMKLGDEVIVGVNSDSFVEQYKGRKPLFSTVERMDMIRKLCPAKVVPNDSAGKEFLALYEPDIIVIGADWYSKDYWTQLGVDRGYFDRNNIELVFFPLVKGLSSSEIKRRIDEQGRTAQVRPEARPFA